PVFRHLIEQVALRQAARRAGSAGGGGGRLGNGEAGIGGQVDHFEVEATPGGELLAQDEAFRRVLPDAQMEVHAVDPVAELGQDVPQRQAVLPAGDAQHEAIVGSEHVVVRDRPLHLAVDVFDEVGGAEVGVVAADLDGGAFPTHPAFHGEPPEITGRSSITSSSPTGMSEVRSSPSRMARYDSGTSSSCRKTSATR